MRRISLLALCLACVAVVLPPVLAKAPRSRTASRKAKPSITAAQVMEKSIEVTGGRKAYEKIKTTVLRGTMEMVGQGLNIQFECRTKTPDKALLIVQIPGVGESRQGYDGKVGWSQDPIFGLRELSGSELAELKRQAADPTSNIKWRELYKKEELVGTKKIGSRTAYEVRLTPTTGKPITHYYDTKTFLLLRMDIVAESPQATFSVESYLSDWRVVDGVKIPHVVKISSPVGDIVMRASEVKNNVKIDDSEFAKPAAPTKPAEPPTPGKPAEEPK
jgi:hypothetical protein